MPIKVKTLCFDLIHWSLILELTRSHGKWNGYPLQYSFLENSMDRGAWWTTVHVVTKSCTIKVTGTLLLLIQYNGARCHQWHVFNVIYIIITFKVCDGQGGLGLISGWGRSPGEGNSYPLGYSDLENSMDRGAWWTTVHEATKIWTWLSNLHFHFCDTEFPNVRRKGKPTHGNLQVRPGGIIYHHILPWITQWILCITINYMPCIILK